METVEIVIRIPKQIYEHINVWKDMVQDDYIAMVANAILNCTVLPKGHGDLKDYNEIQRLWEKGDYDSIVSALIFAPTIIEADKEVDNG